MKIKSIWFLFAAAMWALRPVPSLGQTGQAATQLPGEVSITQTVCRQLADQRQWLSSTERSLWIRACTAGRLSLSRPMLSAAVTPRLVSASAAVTDVGPLVDPSSIRVVFTPVPGPPDAAREGVDFGQGLWGANQVYVDICAADTRVDAVASWRTLPIGPQGRVYRFSSRTTARLPEWSPWDALYSVGTPSYWTTQPPYWPSIYFDEPTGYLSLMNHSRQTIRLQSAQLLCEAADSSWHPCAEGETAWTWASGRPLPFDMACGDGAQLTFQFPLVLFPQMCPRVLMHIQYDSPVDGRVVIARTINCAEKPSAVPPGGPTRP